MLGHMKTHLTEKDAIKAKIKADLSAFKKSYLKRNCVCNVLHTT